MPPYKKNDRPKQVGSKSPKHRGYRAEEQTAGKKARWTAEDRATRGGSAERGRAVYGTRGGSSDAAGRGRTERPNWEPRGKDARRTEREWDSRGRAGRDERPRRDADERPRRSFDDRADRPRRDDDRPRRSFDDRGDRAPRREYDDRPRRSFDDRAPRRDNDDRPRRSFDDRGDRAPRRDNDDRPRRSFDDRGDRAPRRDNDDRPRRSFDDRGGRPERPRRDADDRPRRSFDDRGDRGDRAPRRDSDDRPRRDFSDRPRRSFDDRGDRAPRRDSDDRPRRSFDDRGDRAPRRDHDDRPRRDSSFYPSRDDKPSFNAQDDVVLERLEAEAIQAADVDGVTFADLGFGGNVVRALAELGADKPFPIQAATAPDVLSGKDVLGRGRTGSGKTIAFGAPMVERLMALWAESGKAGGKRQIGRAPRALILAPTRELALQIDRTVQPIARSVGLFTTQIYGGVPQGRQVGALQRGVDIVIGTPGRIEDLLEQGRLDLSEVVITVLDEADHMCDLGFLEPVQRILRETSEGGQKLLFSATLDKGVAQLVDEFLVEPAVHEVAGEDQASSTIDHRVLVIEHRDKPAIIEQLADREGKTLIFARTRAFAEMLADQLDDAGIPAVSLHGDLNQSRRTRNLAQLTSGRVNVLVATDVAARGIHVDDIDLVIQADAPDEYKTYLHRSGRTGRAGKQGTVVTLIPRQRQRRMNELLDRAEIEADFVPAIPGDQLLTDLAQAGALAAAEA
ncbi:DEAD/DEAH box helicase [Leifsonia naganoensis]|uniref:Superfamily II DNA/RNA helicase n=1 Tax=Leifsonia naganoensis TaxID=150025 RepID=A0A853DSF5_9MICO|nr:DEAD/DEAH box helicase [Leifsonia naganoensis]NYK10389.1 superfamily II DNA/RNA helicase [Leifsonia naganoensis]